VEEDVEVRLKGMAGMVSEELLSILRMRFSLGSRKLTDQWVVPHVLTHAGKIGNHADVVALQLLRWTDPGYHEQLRRLDCPGAEDDFFVRVDSVGHTGGVDLDARSCFVISEQDLLCECMGVYCQRRGIEGQVQEGRLRRRSCLVCWIDRG